MLYNSVTFEVLKFLFVFITVSEVINFMCIHSTEEFGKGCSYLIIDMRINCSYFCIKIHRSLFLYLGMLSMTVKLADLIRTHDLWITTRTFKCM